MTIRVDITPPGGATEDLTGRVLFSPSHFSSYVNGAAGDCLVQVRDLGHDPGFVAGSELRLLVDDVVRWAGPVMRVARTWPLPVMGVNPPTTTPRYWELTGADWNILFLKRIVRDLSTPANPVYKLYAPGSYDDDILTDVVTNFSDLVGTDGVTLAIDRISIAVLDVGGITVGGRRSTGAVVWSAGDQLRDVFAAVSRATAGIYYLTPTKVLTYCDVDTPTSDYRLTDHLVADNDIGYRSLKETDAGDALDNDAMVWGAALGGNKVVFSRVQDADSIALHGRWQGANYSQGIYKQTSADFVAGTMVYGTPSSKRGAKNDKRSFECQVDGALFNLGDKVECISDVFGYDEVLPVRKITWTFPTPSTPRQDLLLSYDIDQPWSVYESLFPNMKPPPVSFPVPPLPPIPSDPFTGPVTLCGGGGEDFGSSFGGSAIVDGDWSIEHLKTGGSITPSGSVMVVTDTSDEESDGNVAKLTMVSDLGAPLRATVVFTFPAVAVGQVATGINITLGGRRIDLFVTSIADPGGDSASIQFIPRFPNDFGVPSYSGSTVLSSPVVAVVEVNAAGLAQGKAFDGGGVGLPSFVALGAGYGSLSALEIQATSFSGTGGTRDADTSVTIGVDIEYSTGDCPEVTGLPVVGPVDGETPTDSGDHTTYSVGRAYVPGSTQVAVNGIAQRQGVDYTENPTAATVVFTPPLTAGDTVVISYEAARSPTGFISQTLLGPGLNADTKANIQCGPEGYVAHVFVAGTSSALASVRFQQRGGPVYSGGTGGTMDVAVQNAPSGVPDGTDLAVESYTPGNPGGAWTNFDAVTFSSPATLVEGDPYAIVFRNTDGSPSSNYISVNELYVYDSSPLPSGQGQQPLFSDAAYHILASGPSWAAKHNYTADMDLTYADGHHDGVGYIQNMTTNYGTASGSSDMVREVWTMGASAATVYSAWMRIRRDHGSDPCVLGLYDGSDVLIEEISIPAALVAQSAAGGDTGGSVWVGGSFSVSHVLAAGATYYLRLSTASGSAYTAAPIRKGTTVGFSGDTVFIIGAGQSTTDGGSSWSDLYTFDTDPPDLQSYLGLQA